MDSLWGCQQLLQLGTACTATAAAAMAAAPATSFQSLFDEWGGRLPNYSSPAMPPSPQTMKGNQLRAAAAAEAPSSPSYLLPRNNLPHFSLPKASPKNSPKTPKASRKNSGKEEDEPEDDPCGPSLSMFAGRYGFTITTSNTCTTYSNARCSHEIVLENRVSMPEAESAEENAAAAADPAMSPVKEEPPAVLGAAAAAAGDMVMPWAAGDSSMVLPPMPRLPTTTLLFQASFQQPATPAAAAAAAARPAAAVSPVCSPAFCRTISTGMPGLLHRSSTSHGSQTLSRLATAATAADDIPHAAVIEVTATAAAAAAAAAAPSSHPHYHNMMFAQAWDNGAVALCAVHHIQTADPLQQLSNYLQSLPDPAGEPHRHHEQQHPAVAGWSGLGALQAQTATVFGGAVPSSVELPASTTTEAAAPAAAAMPPDWSPLQSLNLDYQFAATQQYLASHNHQQQQQQPERGTRTRASPTKSGLPNQGKKDGSPSKGRRDGPGSPNRSNKHQSGASAAYQQILRRSLRRPKQRGPSYDPSVKSAVAAAARYGTGASLLGKHRLSNCSSMEDVSAGPYGMPHEWAGNDGIDLNELDSWDVEAFASGCLEDVASMEMAASLGLEGFEGYIWPLDSAFAEEESLQQQKPAYACTPAAAAAAAAAGARRSSSISSAWFRELGVQDLVGSRRGSLFSSDMGVNSSAGLPTLAAAAAAGIADGRSSDAEVDSEVQRGLAFRPVWGVQACVGQVGKQCLIDGSMTPDMFYDGLDMDS